MAKTRVTKHCQTCDCQNSINEKKKRFKTCIATIDFYKDLMIKALKKNDFVTCEEEFRNLLAESTLDVEGWDSRNHPLTDDDIPF